MCTPVVLENIWKHKPQENNCDAVPFVGYLRSCSLAASASNLNPISTFAFFDFIRRYGNETFSWNRLTLSWRRPLSYRNQSIDLLGKSVDWFLYDNDLRHERVKTYQKMYIFGPYFEYPIKQIFVFLTHAVLRSPVKCISVTKICIGIYYITDIFTIK